MNPGYYAPTWSWASVDGAISYHHNVGDRDLRQDIDPTTYDLEVRQLDATSGRITIAGRIIRLKLSCRVRLNNLHQIKPDRHKKFTYVYEMHGDGGRSRVAN